MIKNIEIGHPLYTADGRLTLWGVFKLFSDYLYDTRHWNAESTRTQYQAQIIRMIEVCSLHTAPIESFDSTRIQAIIGTLRDEGKRRGSGDYEETTLRKYEYLLNSVVDAAVANHLIDDPRNETSGTHGIIKNETLKKKVRRCLTAQEEKNIYGYLVNQASSTGEARGLLLAMSLRMRLNEAAALSWNLLTENAVDPAYLQFPVIQSTNLRNSGLKLGTKTMNGVRVLIMSKMESELFVSLRQRLEEQWVAEGRDKNKFGDTRIACRGNQLDTTLFTRQLTEYANSVFAAVGIPKSLLGHLANELIDEAIARTENPDIYPDDDTEYTVSAYILRRLAATHDRILGLSTTERQYAMGHGLSDPLVDPKLYTDAERQLSIARKMDNRVLFGQHNDTPEYVTKDYYTHENYHHSLIIPGKRNAKLIVRGVEPGDPIRIKISAENDVNINLQQYYADIPGHFGDINARRYYHSLYDETNY